MLYNDVVCLFVCHVALRPFYRIKRKETNALNKKEKKAPAMPELSSRCQVILEQTRISFYLRSVLKTQTETTIKFDILEIFWSHWL